MSTLKCCVLLVAFTVMPNYFVPSAAGQEQGQQERAKAQADEGQHTNQGNSDAIEAYRLDFTLSELEDGKKINTRSYSLLAQVGGLNKLRIGGRVPVHTGTQNSASFQYFDIGMNIDCTVEERQGLAVLNTTFDSSSMAGEREPDTHQPLIRQMRSVVRSVVTPGKPTLLTSMDDPTSRARFQIEVTATKVH